MITVSFWTKFRRDKNQYLCLLTSVLHQNSPFLVIFVLKMSPLVSIPSPFRKFHLPPTIYYKHVCILGKIRNFTQVWKAILSKGQCVTFLAKKVSPPRWNKEAVWVTICDCHIQQLNICARSLLQWDTLYCFVKHYKLIVYSILNLNFNLKLIKAKLQMNQSLPC